MSITKYEIDHNIYCTVHDKSTNTVGFCYSVHDSQFCKREKTYTYMYMNLEKYNVHL